MSGNPLPPISGLLTTLEAAAYLRRTLEDILFPIVGLVLAAALSAHAGGYAGHGCWAAVLQARAGKALQGRLSQGGPGGVVHPVRV